ncbi:MULTISPECIES: hypothetical protein [Notoacmeibacter]|nr:MULTISPECIES: hypothetical protein [Notoacmeibacter]MCP1200600.1 hypothetical protein [Notoacmeibacter sp. MSK16QG-6]
MRTILLVLIVAVGGLAACQSVPAVRKNNCACIWEALDGQIDERAMA